MDALTPNPPRDRERVVVFLGFLTSEKCRKACSGHAQPEMIAAMLTRLWFEEIYVPSETGIDTLKPVPDPDDCARFNGCFSAGELTALERFHGFFELRLNFLTNQVYGKAFFPENDSWRSLIEHARHVLSELDPNPEWLQSMLEAMIQNLQKGELKDGLCNPRLLVSPDDT
ncbi:MAG: hypothetical protein OXH34_03185 [Bacteroidetes bacterium]|nr:hypothetical protein [Bacteroidota bacterium]